MQTSPLASGVVGAKVQARTLAPAWYHLPHSGLCATELNEEISYFSKMVCFFIKSMSYGEVVIYKLPISLLVAGL